MKAEMEAVPAPGMRRVLGRMGQCVLTYAALHMTAWVVIDVTAPWADSFKQTMETGLRMMMLIGIPSVLLAVCAGLAHTRTDPVLYRLRLMLPMPLFAFWTLAASTAEPALFQMLVQLLYPWLLPTPLIPENWEGDPL